MKKRLIMMYSIGALLACLGLSSNSFAAVNVFACEPEWAALAEEIGGDLVTVTSATNAYQNVHHMTAKPSLLAAMRRAEMVVCSGADLEIGWLPVLMQKVANSNVQQGTNGFMMASDYVDKLNVLINFDRSMGDVHPRGNPHVHLDPYNIINISSVLKDRLSIIDPDNANTYTVNAQKFTEKWQSAMKRWDKERESLKGQKMVVYHNSWAYLLNWLGMDMVASLEPKPGLPPTAAHLADVLRAVKGQNVTAIIVAPFENTDAAQWLSEKTNIPIIILPFTINGNDKATDLVTLFDETLRLLKEVQ
jgi:zinc/manganese transport system substrate-binding protein